MATQEGNRLSGMDWDEISLVDVPANQLADVVIFKSAEPQESAVPDLAEGTVETLPTEVQEYIGELEKMVAAQEDMLAKGDKKMPPWMKDEDEEEDEVEKALAGADPAIVELVKGLQDRAQSAEILAKAERETRLEREFIAKAHAEFGNIPVDTETLGKSLMHLSESVSEEHVAVITDALAKANGLVGASTIFEEVGSTGDGDAPSGSDALAKVYSRFKAEPGYEGLTQEQAITKALIDNPDLASQVMTEGA